jgi:hypothetical protein
MYFFSKVEGSYALGIKDLRKAVYLNPLSADCQVF